MQTQRTYDISDMLRRVSPGKEQLTLETLSSFYEKASRFLEPKGSQFSYRWRERQHGEIKEWQRLQELIRYECIRYDQDKGIYTLVFREAPNQQFNPNEAQLYFAFDEARALYVRKESGKVVSEELYIRKSPIFERPNGKHPTPAPHIRQLPLS